MWKSPRIPSLGIVGGIFYIKLLSFSASIGGAGVIFAQKTM